MVGEGAPVSDLSHVDESGRVHMRLTPSTSVVSCSDTSPNALLPAATTATGALQPLWITPYPAAMGHFA